MENLLAFCLLFGLLLLEVVLYAWIIVMYILESMSWYAISKRRGLPNPWMAWIPFANSWLLGSISDQYQQLVKGRMCKRRKILLVLKIVAQVVVTMAGVIAGVVAGLGIVAQVYQNGGGVKEVLVIFFTAVGVALIPSLAVSIVHDVFSYICCYDVFASCKPKKAVCYLLLSIFLPIRPFLLFSCRNSDEGMPPVTD